MQSGVRVIQSVDKQRQLPVEINRLRRVRPLPSSCLSLTPRGHPALVAAISPEKRILSFRSCDDMLEPRQARLPQHKPELLRTSAYGYSASTPQLTLSADFTF
jgi:hypothetical protein